MNKGIIYGMAAYTAWGLLPVYWKAIQHVEAAEIIVHRILWSLALLVVLLALRRRWHWLRLLRRDRRTGVMLLLAAGLLAVNWFTYIWGVNHGFVIESSLGYFTTPLVSVTLGVLILHERLRPWQWVAVGLAAAGVIYLTLSYGRLPWIALSLAFTFSFYGLLKKRLPLEALDSLSVEMAILALPALAYLLWLSARGAATFGQADVQTHVLLIGAGAITAVPLLWFSAAAQRIPLSMLGLLQYIAPTLQFLLGLFLYGEPFSMPRLVGFSIIWLALGIYTIENTIERRRRLRPAPV